MAQRSADADRRSDEQGSFSIERPASTVVRLQASGYLSEAVGRELCEELRHTLEGGQGLHVFFDAEAVDAYHSSVRIGVTAVLLNNLTRIGGISVLARSTLVHMGVAVANLALNGRIHAF